MQPVRSKVPRAWQAARMALISAWAVGSWFGVTRFAPRAMIRPSWAITAPKGPPPARTFSSERRIAPPIHSPSGSTSPERSPLSAGRPGTAAAGGAPPAGDGSASRPALAVITLGSTASSPGPPPAEKPFNDSYARAIDYLRSIWGQVPILCVAPSDNTVVLRYLEQLIAERQDANLHFTAILPGVTNWDSDMGANYHPNHHGHRKLAMSVIPYIATITGWELPDTSVE